MSPPNAYIGNVEVTVEVYYGFFLLRVDLVETFVPLSPFSEVSASMLFTLEATRFARLLAVDLEIPLLRSGVGEADALRFLVPRELAVEFGVACEVVFLPEPFPGRSGARS